MDFTPSFLEESATARDEGLKRLKTQTNEEHVLNKVKALMFAVWEGKSRVSRKDLADFYEIHTDTLDKNYKRNKDEFDRDGVKVFRGKALDDVRDKLSLSHKASSATIYTAAGALRMGFILRDSEVAKEVRNVVIQMIQGVGKELGNKVVLQSLIQSHPILATLAEGRKLKISAPYSRYWDKMKSTLRKQHPDGGIAGYSKEKIRKSIQFLSTYTNDFKLQGKRELTYEIANEVKAKYPELISDIFYYQNVDGTEGKAVFMFQFDKLIIGQDFVERCIGRNYIQIAKESLGVDKAYLVFVAPFGVDSYAEDYIRNRLPVEHQGNVGVCTVKELASFLYTQADSARKLNTVRGELKREFKDMVAYEFPDPPAVFEQLVLDC